MVAGQAVAGLEADAADDPIVKVVFMCELLGGGSGSKRFSVSPTG